MMQLSHPLFRILVYTFFAAVFAVLFALHAHAEDTPAPAPAPLPIPEKSAAPAPALNAPAPGAIPTFEQAQAGLKGELPLDRPSIEIAELLPWVSETVTEVYTLDKDTYQDRLKVASKKFTKEGWKQFTGVLAQNRVVERLKTEGLVISLTAGKPVLLAEEVEDGVYHWMFSMTATISNWNESDQTNEQTTIMIKIVRVPAKENALGFQISSWQQT
jgi:hypothetical protein